VIFHFLQDARIEFDYAVDWYDSRQPGLGDDFSREVYDTIRRIIANPHAFVRAPRVPKKREVRILPVHRFEYLLVYEVLSAEIVIIGVPHARRGVQHWRKRL
jgi:plasmid stabilization system protein ParE